MARELLVFGDKTFKITVPDESKITFAPFSPPGKDAGNWAHTAKAAGTLRIYAENNEKRIIAVFSGVTGFRDLALDYAEEVAREEGATIWKSDRNGYQREDKVSRVREWVPQAELIIAANGDEDAVF